MIRIESTDFFWVGIGLILVTGNLLAGISFAISNDMVYLKPLVIAALIPGFLIGAALATRSVTSLGIEK